MISGVHSGLMMMMFLGDKAMWRLSLLAAFWKSLLSSFKKKQQLSA
jgi:hypothetical protein